jgi:glutathionylspermidine synthase
MTRTALANLVPPSRAPSHAAASHPLRAGATLDQAAFAAARRKMALTCCKWDPQVGDVATLAPFPLIIGLREWDGLRVAAEALARELAAAEVALLVRPDLYRTVAIPRSLRRAVRKAGRVGPTPALVRLLRFDFHWTTDGWRISEVNSDVPGGFAEASELPRLVAANGGVGNGISTAGDPAAAWAEAIAARSPASERVAVLSAPGFMEDFQVVSYMAGQLAARGLACHLAAPTQLDWSNGRAHLRTAGYDGPVGAVVRFFQAEWLARLHRSYRHRELIARGRTPVTNPGTSILTESKRFPLTWDRLGVAMPTWRRLLPESRDPRDAPWRHDESWLLKTAFCNTGDTVTARDLLTPKQWRAACRNVWLRPGQWVAQRRFETVAVDTPMGEVYPCVGVYTVNGRACGAYTRIAPRAVIDYRAVDAALLVEGPEAEGGTG